MVTGQAEYIVWKLWLDGQIFLLNTAPNIDLSYHSLHDAVKIKRAVVVSEIVVTWFKKAVRGDGLWWRKSEEWWQRKKIFLIPPLALMLWVSHNPLSFWALNFLFLGLSLCQKGVGLRFRKRTFTVYPDGLGMLCLSQSLCYVPCHRGILLC